MWNTFECIFLLSPTPRNEYVWDHKKKQHKHQISDAGIPWWILCGKWIHTVFWLKIINHFTNFTLPEPNWMDGWMIEWMVGPIHTYTTQHIYSMKFSGIHNSVYLKILSFVLSVFCFSSVWFAHSFHRVYILFRSIPFLSLCIYIVLLPKKTENAINKSVNPVNGMMCRYCIHDIFIVTRLFVCVWPCTLYCAKLHSILMHTKTAKIWTWNGSLFSLPHW